MKINKLKSILSIGLILGCAGSAVAHDTWGVMPSYKLKAGQAAEMDVVSSHLFCVPADAKTLVESDTLAQVIFKGPAGDTLGLASPDKTFKSAKTFKASGTYLAVAVSKPGFKSKTTDGYKTGTKKDFSDVIECSYSEKFAKAIFTVGAAGGKAWGQELGHKLEIVPLQDPATLKAGDTLQIKVLFEGKPFATTVSGTYAGFSEEQNTWAYTTSSNKEGIAKIKLVHGGAWLLVVKQKLDYPDKTVADKLAYSAALTFSVK